MPSAPTQYAGPTEIVHRRGRLYLFDAGAGEIIAEFSDEAAAVIHGGKITSITPDGKHVTINTE